MARALPLALAVMASGQQALEAEVTSTEAATTTMMAATTTPKELDDVTWTCASLLIAFVVFSGFLACLLHWNNKDIRKEAWSLVNTTISIFCAAGIDFAFYRLIRLVLPEDQREAPEQSWWFLSLVLGFTCLAPLMLNHKLLSIDDVDEDQHQKLFAWSTMGGHVCAFLAVLYFGLLPHAKVHFEGPPWISLPVWVWLLPLLAFVFFFLVMKLIGWLARCRGQDHKHMQAHQAGDALTEACAITVSFLLVQAVCYHMSTECDDRHAGDVEECEARRFMPIMHGEFGTHVDFCVLWLVLLACGLMLASTLWSLLRAQRAATIDQEEASDGFDFLPACIGQTLPVTAAWCAQRAGVIGLYGGIEARMNWYLTHYLHNCDEHEHEHECLARTVHPQQAANRTQIANALVMSAVALIGLFSVTKLADWIKNRIRFCAPEEDAERDAESGSEESWNSPGSKSVAKSLRKAVMAFGMLTGICWEKAFDTSYETMLNERALSILFENTWWEKHFDEGHSVKAQVFIAIAGGLLSIAVIPAWYCYIVPRAMKGKKLHSRELKLEGSYRPKMPKERTPTKRFGLSDSSDSSESD
ncbi:unnamed protein product [Symbiodinium sp. CCMP2456]|nr:unnamed protein product [Symbiodinium sp. CCMP2456]